MSYAGFPFGADCDRQFGVWCRRGGSVNIDETATPVSKPAVLEAEYEHEAVPSGARKSLGSVSLVWLGFPMVLTMALIGSLVVEGLGFQQGVLAIIVGNLVLFAYVGALSLLAEKDGLSFALLASTTLGKKGYVA